MVVEVDDDIENYIGEWFFGELVGWNYYLIVDLWIKLVNFYQDVKLKFNDVDFVVVLKVVVGDQVFGFNFDLDS